MERTKCEKSPLTVQLICLLGYELPEAPIAVGKTEKYCIFSIAALSTIYAFISVCCLTTTSGMAMWLALLLNFICVFQSVGILLRQHEEYVSKKHYENAKQKNTHDNELFDQTDLFIKWENYIKMGYMSPYKKRITWIFYTMLLVIAVEIFNLLGSLIYRINQSKDVALFVFSIFLLLLVMSDIWIDQIVAYYRAEA